MVLFLLPVGTDHAPLMHPYQRTSLQIQNRTWRKMEHLPHRQLLLQASSYLFPEVLQEEFLSASMLRFLYIWPGYEDILQSRLNSLSPHLHLQHHGNEFPRMISHKSSHCFFPFRKTWRFSHRPASSIFWTCILPMPQKTRLEAPRIKY